MSIIDNDTTQTEHELVNLPLYISHLYVIAITQQHIHTKSVSLLVDTILKMFHMMISTIESCW